MGTFGENQAGPDGSLAVSPPQVLNPETSEDEVDHVVVMDKSDEQWLKATEVLPAQARWGGRSGKITEVCDEPAATPQDKSKDSEESRGSESEDESSGGRARRRSMTGHGPGLLDTADECAAGWEGTGEWDRGGLLSPRVVCLPARGQADCWASVPQGGEESEDEEKLGDEAMMALDQNLTSIFAEQKLWIQAQQDEKSKPQKEKVLQCDFQIWVSLGAGASTASITAPPTCSMPCPHLADQLSRLQVLDLVEVLVTKQPENVLVLELLEPLLGIIQCSLRSSNSKQEQDLLHKTVCIFMWAWEQGGWVWLAVPSPQPPGRTPGLLSVQEREPSFQPGP
ncbi:hypothetical protein P7K49_041004 [Saguinus oedipus]|uniref:Uncharacterized protein n=1 Tax=Saguinus oedipus TaxID=9490 RepID=A0ABQ9T940_SAGOE|nr:hypothetical protein P7K49_040383 [Saguinus oedipus]KAK2081371.1 hypothetical protein P7K49_041004 [Saguinus oedipus]